MKKSSSAESPALLQELFTAATNPYRSREKVKKVTK
jgi:hypothetical protein